MKKAPYNFTSALLLPNCGCSRADFFTQLLGTKTTRQHGPQKKGPGAVGCI